MPTKFRKRTVMVCHDDYGHLGDGQSASFVARTIFLAKDVRDV